MEDWTPVLAALFGSGGAATVWVIVQGIKSLREGASARTREVMSDLERYRGEMEIRAVAAERDRDYWRYVAGKYHYQLLSGGATPEPTKPIPPSEREKVSDGSTN